jgi:hypothetical protein
LGHNDVKTTMIYTHVLGKGGQGVFSPLDSLGAGGGISVVRPENRAPTGGIVMTL